MNGQGAISVQRVQPDAALLLCHGTRCHMTKRSQFAEGCFDQMACQKR